MKAVIERNHVIFVCEDVNLAQKVADARIALHKEELAAGSWRALFKPEEHIFVTSEWHCSQQFLRDVDFLWCAITHDAVLDSFIREEKSYIESKRKTDVARMNLALDRGATVLSKLVKKLKWDDSRDYAYQAARKVLLSNNGCVTSFSRVFAAYVADTKVANSKLLLPTASIYSNTPLSLTAIHPATETSHVNDWVKERYL